MLGVGADAVTPAPVQGGGSVPPDELGEPKARKACINCRKQKMKCRLDSGDSCRRCSRAGVPCIFVPRANAAGLPGTVTIERSRDSMSGEIFQRLKAIEEHLGFANSGGSSDTTTVSPVLDADDEDLDEVDNLSTVWAGVKTLKKCGPPSVNPVIWQRKTIKHLFQTFHDRMPGLHFLPNRQKFSSPNPLLLASILYCSSLRGEPEMAAISPHYFTVLCNAIAQLSVPNGSLGDPPSDPQDAEEWAFQTVLGIILAGLLAEARKRETGVWISVAYRLILEHCPSHADEKSREWRKLFSGIQIVDLEHASIHMSCPVIPIEAPLPTLQISHRDQLYRLSRMMHTGLTHFTGRGLPTIWSCFTGAPGDATNWTSTFTAIDAAVIRDWARQLDEWLGDFTSDNHDTEHEKTLVLRQYILHRLTVLSIYHPARGCNLYANGVTPKEQYELLFSARAALKLHRNDNGIWSNWDLVMITWAAMIVIQGIEGGAGEPEDIQDINVHLAMLKQTNEPKPGLRDKLVERLEQSLEGVQNRSPQAFTANPMSIAAMDASLDYSWQIFDQTSLQHMAYPAWHDPSQVPPPELKHAVQYDGMGGAK